MVTPFWEQYTPEQRRRLEQRHRALAEAWGVDVVTLKRTLWREVFRLQRERPERFQNTKGDSEEPKRGSA